MERAGNQPTSELDGGWVVNATSLPLYPRKRHGTHCIGRWVGPGLVWTGAENLVTHQDSITGPFSP